MKQGKVVILGGTPRAGKTMLAVRLTRQGFNRISWDALSDAVQKGFPEVTIDDWTNREMCAAKMYPFFEFVVGSAVNDAAIYGLNTVIDQYDFTPEYIDKLPYKKDIAVYILAYPDIPVERIRHNIRHFAKPEDWIAQVDAEYLNVIAERCYHMNEVLKKQCAMFRYELIDTGEGEQREKALDGLFARIMAD